jgi:DNA transposition AAA+ family ATPase
MQSAIELRTPQGAGLETFTDECIIADLKRRGIEPKEIKAKTGCSFAAVMGFLQGKSSSQRLREAILTEFFESQAGEEEKSRFKEVPTFFANPSFVLTPTAKEIFSVLQWAQEEPGIAAIQSDAGFGKTVACLHYESRNRGVHYVRFTPGSGNLRDCLKAICDTLHLSSYGGVYSLSKSIQLFLSDTVDLWDCGPARQKLLVLDEAQHLTLQAFDELRCFYDKGLCGLVYIGNATVFRRIKGGNARTSDFSQLHSRVRKWLSLSSLHAGDIEQIAGLYGVRLKPELELAARIAAKPGALRVLSSILSTARSFANTEGKSIVVRHILMACRDSGDHSLLLEEEGE